MIRLLLRTLLVLLLIQPALADPNGLGTSEPIPFSLEGKVYLLPNGTRSLPDFSQLTPVGSIYTKTLSVTARDFTSGFPGVTDRFEWFGIDYRGQFYLGRDGEYTFRLTSDDGAIMWIDDQQLINNDGVHPAISKNCTVNLKAGVHTMRVAYFQGPRTRLALVLEVAEPGGQFEPFIPPRMTLGDSKKDATGKTRVTMKDAILFDYDKSNLRPQAQAALANLKATLIDAKPGRLIVVEGHTDSKGSDEYNQALSEKRARSVADWLIKNGVEARFVKAIGYGESRPTADNATDAGRAQNRRVELLIP